MCLWSNTEKEMTDDKNRVELIKFLKVVFCSDHEVFFHVFLLIIFCSHTLSVLKHSTVAGTYFNEIKKYIILVTYVFMHTILKKKNKGKKGKLNVTSLANINFKVL